MKQFFKFLFASILGFFVSIVLLCFILVGIVMAAAGGGEDKEVTVKPHSILTLKLDYAIP
jgi:protease-4